MHAQSRTAMPFCPHPSPLTPITCAHTDTCHRERGRPWQWRGHRPGPPRARFASAPPASCSRALQRAPTLVVCATTLRLVLRRRTIENKKYEAGFTKVFGVDEAGRGVRPHLAAERHRCPIATCAHTGATLAPPCDRGRTRHGIAWHSMACPSPGPSHPSYRRARHAGLVPVHMQVGAAACTV